MKRIYLALLCITLCLLSCSEGRQSEDSEQAKKADTTAKKPAPKEYNKIITLGHNITKIVIDLGLGDRIVAVDQAYPAIPVTSKLPNIGYGKLLRMSKIKKHQPDLIIAPQTRIPKEIIRALDKEKIETKIIPASHTLQDIKDQIMSISTLLGLKGKGKQLILVMDGDLSLIRSKTFDIQQKPKVAFIQASNPDNAMIAGVNTPANLMIELAGAQNAFNDFEGLKRIEDQDLVNAAPTIFLMTTQDFESFGGKASLVKLPGYLSTYAGRMGSIILVDAHLLGDMGSGLGQNALTLAKKFYPNKFIEENK